MFRSRESERGDKEQRLRRTLSLQIYQSLKARGSNYFRGRGGEEGFFLRDLAPR